MPKNYLHIRAPYHKHSVYSAVFYSTWGRQWRTWPQAGRRAIRASRSRDEDAPLVESQQGKNKLLTPLLENQHQIKRDLRERWFVCGSTGGQGQERDSTRELMKAAEASSKATWSTTWDELWLLCEGTVEGNHGNSENKTLAKSGNNNFHMEVTEWVSCYVHTMKQHAA